MSLTNIPFTTKEAFQSITDYWSPKVISEFNGQYVKIAKLKGDFVWHDHKEEDELFLVVKGSLSIDFEDKIIHLKEGEGFVVPKATMHKPHCEEECWVMLIEPKETKHTGDVETKYTKSIDEQLK
ncbi:MAG: cupin domain-containing protein [Cyclobacteriaceae bacterium]|nr:cupin domain-containing protein [Cyclobacteriaceae bacterium]